MAECFLKKRRKKIKVLLSRPWPKEYQREQRRLAEENSWEKKVAAMSKAMVGKQRYGAKPGAILA